MSVKIGSLLAGLVSTTVIVIAANPSIAAPSLISSFETTTDVSGVQVANATAARCTTWATAGSSSVSLTFAAGSWAQAMVTFPAQQDWSGTGGLAFDLQNTGSAPVTIALQLDDSANASIGARITIPAGGFATAIAPFAATPSGQPYLMKSAPPLAPGGKMLGAWGSMNLAHVVDYRFYTLNLSTAAHINLDNVRTVSPYSASTFTNLVDQYGQPTARTVSSTPITADADFAARTATEQTWLQNNPVPADRDSYGGLAAGPSVAATGYFGTTKLNGKWWLVTPQGHLFFSAGVDSVIPTQPSITQGREAMFQSLPATGDPMASFFGTVQGTPVSPGTSTTYDFYGANLSRKYGANSVDAWKTATTQRLKSWGFNTIGWTDQAFASAFNTPYTMMLSTSGSYHKVSTGADVWGAMADPYDPAFATALTNNVAWQTANSKSDPMCVGYFVDNELSWANWQSNSRYALTWGALTQDTASSPAKAAFISLLQAEYSTVGALNAVWGTTFSSWTAAGLPWTAQSQPSTAVQADLSRLSLAFARQYFTTVRSIVKAKDPNHLYLGCRFGYTTPEALQASSESCDVVSFNVYGADLAGQASTFASLNKPVLIGEFHFGATDQGMFSPGLVDGFNQAGRGTMYSNYITSALNIPSVVGCHWFQYSDQPVVGRTFDGENYNIGFVDITDTPYWPLVNAARATNSSIYSVRGY